MAGAILGMLGEYDAAQPYCEKVVRLNPHAHGPYLNLANIHMVAERYDEARQNLEQALERQPGDSQILSMLGVLYIKTRQIDSAIKTLQQAINVFPGNYEACNNLGVAYREKGDLDTAEKCFRKALTLQPAFIDAHCNLAGIFSDRLMFDEAESCYTKALQADPDNRAALCGLGKLFQSKGEFEKAGNTYQRALALAPGDVELLSSIATLHERCGNHLSALQTLEPMVNSGHASVDAMLTYSTLCRKQARHNDATPLLEQLLESPQSRNDQINILFALGDLYDELHEYDKAFEHFRQANELDSTNAPESGDTVHLDIMQDFFSKTRLPHLPQAHNDSQLPVFIVGMPRSGTSLVEQILATHPDITPGDERDDIGNIVETLGSRLNTSGTYPEILLETSPGQLDGIAADYLALISSLAGNSLRFTDKTPLHGLHLGLINLLLPASRVIVCNRNPLDTCLSVYFHRFNSFHNYAKNLGTLGRFYRDYHRLIEHWKSILDIQIMEVQYEQLVNDSEQTIRNIIDFCGLEWAPECLDFHNNKRTMNTPSYNQVRKPMYSSSIGRWENYEQHIQPLIDTLDHPTPE